MKTISINGFFLTRPFSGTGTYTISLLKALSLLDRKNRYLLILPRPLSNLKLPDNFSPTILPFCRFLPGLSLRKFFWEQWQIPALARRLGVNVLHTPYPANPYSGFWRSLPFRNIVTVHDLIPWRDQRYRAALKARFYQWFSRFAVQRADLVVCVSKTTGADFQAFLPAAGRPPVLVARNFPPPPAAGDFFCPSVAASDSIFAPPTSPYLLYVGGYDPRKNVAAMIEAFLAVNRDHRWRLVLVGDAYGSALSSRPRSHQDLIYTGFLPPKALTDLYRNAGGFVNFSQSEGFNLPLLEAAGHGLAIAASPLAVHREVLGRAAVFAADFSPAALQAAIKKILTLSPAERKNHSLLALKAAAHFSWREEGEKILANYLI